MAISSHLKSKNHNKIFVLTNHYKGGDNIVYSLFQKPQTQLNFTIYSHRFYGEPKLSKPKEIRGIKQAFSVDYIPKKCRCQVFINGDDVWVKHGDYFSEAMSPEPHEIGMPLNYFCEKYMGKNRAKKFIYGDSWGSVILRNEAWIKIDNLIKDIENEAFILDVINEICRQQEKYHSFDEYELSPSYMERFWENLIKELISMY